MYHDENIKYQFLCSELSSRQCVVWYKFRYGNESIISWVEFRKSAQWKSGSGLLNGCVCLFTTAVKVQKSNHHHWDQSSNYCHPPHASHGKTWSSPSHPHNQQDHCKCKLSLVTALLLARHQSRRLFFSTFVKSISRRFTPTSVTTFLSFAVYSRECMLLLLLLWIKKSW